MKKFLGILVLISLALPAGALIQAQVDEVEELTTLPVIETLDKVANIIFTLLLAIAGVMIVVAGLRFVFAGGNPEEVSRARDVIMYALIGIIVAFLAKGIVWFIKGYLLG
jgi:hypothetical protein